MSQTLPDFPEDLNPEVVLECVAEGIRNVPYEARIVANWVIEVYEIVDRLIDQRRRCNEMTNDRLHQACIYNWTIAVLFNANSLRNDLAVLTDPETARIFEEHFLDCFGVEPEA